MCLFFAVPLAYENMSTRANVDTILSPKMRESSGECCGISAPNPNSRDCANKEAQDTEVKTAEAKQLFAEMLHSLGDFFGPPVCEKRLIPIDARSLCAGVTGAGQCHVRHASTGSEWGHQGFLKLVQGAPGLLRWRYDSTNPKFPVMFIFAVEVRGTRRYVRCDQRRQRIRLHQANDLPDPEGIDVDSDTTDPRLFVYNEPLNAAGGSGYLHPSYTWNNPSETVLSVSEENQRVVLAQHHPGADTWVIEEV